MYLIMTNKMILIAAGEKGGANIGLLDKSMRSTIFRRPLRHVALLLMRTYIYHYKLDR